MVIDWTVAMSMLYICMQQCWSMDIAILRVSSQSIIPQVTSCLVSYGHIALNEVVIDGSSGQYKAGSTHATAMTMRHAGIHHSI